MEELILSGDRIGYARNLLAGWQEGGRRTNNVKGRLQPLLAARMVVIWVVWQFTGAGYVLRTGAARTWELEGRMHHHSLRCSAITPPAAPSIQSWRPSRSIPLLRNEAGYHEKEGNTKTVLLYFI